MPIKLLISVLLLAASAWASTINASSCSQSDVQTAFSAAGATSTASTLNFTSTWTAWASCTVSASTATALPYVSAISTSSVTFTYVTTGTPTLYYHCFGQ